MYEAICFARMQLLWIRVSVYKDLILSLEKALVGADFSVLTLRQRRWNRAAVNVVHAIVCNSASSSVVHETG